MGREAAVMDWEQKFPFLREKGHVVSLIGGGGKTTLVKLLMRLYDPSSGVITLGGRDIREYERRRRIFGSR
mgnify:CR=1 FL=1